jgi:hypothetical protein
MLKVTEGKQLGTKTRVVGECGSLLVLTTTRLWQVALTPGRNCLRQRPPEQISQHQVELPELAVEADAVQRHLGCHAEEVAQRVRALPLQVEGRFQPADHRVDYCAMAK